jgi:peptidoglycan LD-endopeptidase LytH
MFRGIVKTAVLLGASLFLVALATALLYRPRTAGTDALAGESALAPLTPAGLVVVQDSDLAALRERNLLFPVPDYDMRRLRDSFDEPRGASRRHGALDLKAPRGTPVRAVDDGAIAKLHDSVGKGGLSIYQFDPEGTYCYYYAHLDSYAAGLRDGAALKKGDVVGYVGSTGNAPPQTPHLHFAIVKLGPEKRWGHGVAINAFTLWAPR